MKTSKVKQLSYEQAFYRTIFLLFCFLGMTMNAAKSQVLIALVDFIEININPYPEEDKIVLEWSVSSATTEDMYIIERAGSDGNFIEIGRVDGVSIFADMAPLEGENIYQLAQNTIYGKVICTDQTSIIYYRSRGLNLTPNPVSNNLQVHYKVEKNATIQIQIFSQYGNILQQFNPNTSVGGNRHISINVNSYPSGLYFVRLVDGAAIETKQFYKQ
jgi:hypothetical protein